jgi:hypothetical protein
MFKLLLLFVGLYTKKLNTRLSAIRNVMKSTKYVDYADVYLTGIDHRYIPNNKTKEESARQLDKCIKNQHTMNKLKQINNIKVNYAYEDWIYHSVSYILDDDNHKHNNMVGDLYSGLDTDF